MCVCGALVWNECVCACVHVCLRAGVCVCECTRTHECMHVLCGPFIADPYAFCIFHLMLLQPTLYRVREKGKKYTFNGRDLLADEVEF